MRSALLQFATFIVLTALPAAAQQKDQAPNPSPGPSPGESSSRHGDAPPPPADETGSYDPVSAQEDIDVGIFYLHKGDIDAAISRFQDAIRLRSDFAKPRLLLAQAYEKKKDKTNAIKYYKEYLQVYPKAPDAKAVQNKIEKLSGG
jgi:tetratricopeptide (TPR) repeat protein